MKMQFSLITVVLVGMVGFLLPLYDFLGHIDNWEVIDQPHGISQLIWCVICGLIAIGAAMGINVRKILLSFGAIEDMRVSDTTRDELVNREEKNKLAGV